MQQTAGKQLKLDEERTRFRFGHAAIDVVDKKAAVDSIIRLAQVGEKGSFVVTPNADHLVQLETDQKLRNIYQAADLVVADGMPLIWFSRILKPALPERVTGSDLMPELCRRAEEAGLSIFFFGAQEGVAAQAAVNTQRQFPRLKIAGAYSPPFGFEKDRAQTLAAIDVINAAAPHILFVGLGAPKQEYWMYDYRKLIRTDVMLGIGAGIDFMAGNVARAPLWMQRAGLEWVYRLSREPKRLYRRYARDFGIFLIFFRELIQRFANRK